MKTYFARLFNYDLYANQLLLKSIIEAGSPEKPVQLMAHLLAAQQVWLARCKNEIADMVLWPDWKAPDFESLVTQNHQQWIDYLNVLGDTDFDRLISYQNTKGQAFNNLLSDITAHVINHGTHHRAQIGQLLKLTGIEKLPVTDYIAFVR